MADSFEDISENFEFIDEWEDRYRYVIELGKAMDPMDPALQIAATKVDGCASQVWIAPEISGEGILAIDPMAVLGSLGLDQHLSSQRSNGFKAMVARIREIATRVQESA